MLSGLAVGSAVIGLVFIILVLAALRLMPKNGEAAKPGKQTAFPVELDNSAEATLLIQAGGRVEYMSALARSFFDVRPHEPYDLERLARRVRPAEDFLNLCAAPGQKRLSIAGKLFEVSSYQVPGEVPVMLVSLRSKEFSSIFEHAESGASSEILKIVSDFSQAIAANLDLETTVRAVINNVSRLIPADVVEVKLWDAAQQTLIPYQLDREQSASPFGRLTQTLVAQRAPLLIPNILNQPELLQGGEPLAVQSYLGIPLMAGGQWVGSLEAGQANAATLDQRHLELLQLVAGQAAAAIRNAKLYDEEQKRAAELAGLAKLNQMLGAAQDTRRLYDRLVESIAPLFDADMVGFLLYDDAKHTLEAKSPFRGLPNHLLDMFRAAIPAESPADQIVNSQKPLLTLHAAADENWRALGLSDIALAASLRDVALVPLISSGRSLGYLQVGHHRRGASAFTEDELRLMNIVASQSAAIIENVLLLLQSRSRAARADTLHRLASLANSGATLDEIFKYSIPQLAHLLQADMGALFLVDEARGELRLRRESAFGVPESAPAALTQIFMSDPKFPYTVSGSGKYFTSGKLSADRRVLALYRPLVTTLHIESAIVVPLTVRNRSIGELMIGSYKAEQFNNLDLQTALSAASYLAAAIESANLMSQTDETLRRRLERLTTISRVSRELGASLEINSLLQIIHGEALNAVKADCCSALTFDSNRADALVVKFVSGCQPNRELTPLEETILQSGEAQMIGDYSQEGIFPPHDGARSAIIAPIIYQRKKMGLINVHSARANFFNADAVDLLSALALQAGVALNNAQRYQAEKSAAEQTRRRADTLTRMSEVSFNLDEEQPVEKILQTIAQGICEVTSFRVALISLLEADSGLLRRVAAVGIPQEKLNELLSRKQPLSSVQQLMKPEFKTGHSYFIPADDFPVIPSDVHVVTLDVSAPAAISAADAWNPKDALLVPLENAQGEMIGIISLDDPQHGLRPDKATLESAEAFAAQAAFFITASQKRKELQASIESLTAGLQRQQNLLSITQNDLPILLRKDLEQTISLHNLDRRAQRVRAGLEITESVSRQLDAASALSALGRETLTQLEMAVALVAENTPEGPRLLHVLGSLPRSTHVESLFGQRNPLRACLQNGKPILIANLDENEEWRDSSLLTALRSKAVICLPILVEGKVVAAMLAVNPEPMSELKEEDRQVYLQISQQTSVILQNISLLNQTRRRLEEVNLLLDFSRSLSGLEADEIVVSLLQNVRRVLHNAHAGAALLWNPQIDALTPRAVSGYADDASMMKINYHIGEALPGVVFNQRSSRRVDEINFARDYNLPPERLALYRQGTGGRLPVSSLLVPIVAGGQGLGMIVLDNFNSTAAFQQDDELLLVSLAQQVALSLDNLRLVRDSQARAGLLEALNNSSSSMTSNLESAQLVNSLLDHFASIIPYDTATLWLRDKERLAVASARGFADADQRLGLSVPVSDSALFKEMAQTGAPILVNDVREDHRFPPVEAERLSWLGIPLISKGELMGAIAVEKIPAHFYTTEQMQIGLTFASQAGVSLENARLFEDSLSRATELTQRSQRLATLNRFASALTGLLDVDQILVLTANELLQGLEAERVSVVTFERGAASWKFAAPRVRVPLPRALPAAPIFNRLRESLGAFNTDRPALEPDIAPLMDMIGEDAAHLLILPIAVSGELFALLFVQNAAPEARFGANELEVARTITSQASIALENARLYQTAASAAGRFSVLNETSSQISSSLDPEQVYESIYHAATRLMPLDSFIISLLDEDKNEIDAVYLLDRGKRYPAERVPFGVGLSSEVIQSGKPLLVSTGEQIDAMMETVQTGEAGEETQSIVAVPMTLGGKTLGMLSVQSYQRGVYTEEDVQILGTLANQAIVAIQNGKLFAETQKLAAQLEARVAERTVQLRREQQSTETLLNILTEVSSSLDLDRALNRTLSLLNKATGAEQGTIMLLNAEDNLLHYRAGYGYLSAQPEAGNRSVTLKVGEGLAGWVVQNREAALIHDLHRDPRWVRNSSGQDHRSAIVIPMIVVDDVIGVLMIFHREEHFFSAELLSLVKAIAGQVAVAINNAHLYELIRDQAERLGVMLRKEQEDASRLQAVLQAVADGVLVTGADNSITFINSTAEKILKLKSPQLLNKTFQEVGDLLPQNAAAWMDTIHRWSEDPSLYEQGEYYAEKLEMQDNRVALVHLAPVILQNDFLGTVSIFRDITQEVEVDRLKSEFVATVSHELRTPMTSVKGYVDLLLMGATGALNENQMHFLEIVRNNVDRLNSLVGDLLDVSRIESGHVILEKTPVDLHGIAENIVAETLNRSQRENKPIALSLESFKEQPRVLGDNARVRQILENLVDNAYSYTPRNGTISVRIHQEGDFMQVDVKDNGVGIPPADQYRIFERFYRGEHPLVLATPGTGLGLPIVRELVEMHNGKIWMTSSGIPGEGCAFSFTLPIYK
ncbi:MAG: hypothetical protein Fur002_15990 [Anaerolineales bacterium]